MPGGLGGYVMNPALRECFGRSWMAFATRASQIRWMDPRQGAAGRPDLVVTVTARAVCRPLVAQRSRHAMKAATKIFDHLSRQVVHFGDLNRVVAARAGFTGQSQFGNWRRRINGRLHRMVAMAASTGGGMKHAPRDRCTVNASPKSQLSFDVTVATTLPDALSVNRQSYVRAMARCA